jgi:hypothetical protein
MTLRASGLAPIWLACCSHVPNLGTTISVTSRWSVAIIVSGSFDAIIKAHYFSPDESRPASMATEIVKAPEGRVMSQQSRIVVAMCLIVSASHVANAQTGREPTFPMRRVQHVSPDRGSESRMTALARTLSLPQSFAVDSEGRVSWPSSFQPRVECLASDTAFRALRLSRAVFEMDSWSPAPDSSTVLETGTIRSPSNGSVNKTSVRYARLWLHNGGAWRVATVCARR